MRTTICRAAGLLTALATLANAQDNGVVLDRALRARAVLAPGIDAIGGLAALERISDVTRVTSGARTVR